MLPAQFVADSTAEEISDVGQRIADANRLPVKHGDRLSACANPEQHVVEPEIAVHQANARMFAR